MDLRDRFAARFAAAMTNALSDPRELARRAYDLAEAMLEERDRRVELEEAAAGEGRDVPFDEAIPDEDAYHAARAALLDDPEPMEAEPDWLLDEERSVPAEGWTASTRELPDWLEAPYDPRWELEARWGSHDSVAPSSPKPGLARTQPQVSGAPEGDEGQEGHDREQGEPARRLHRSG